MKSIVLALVLAGGIWGADEVLDRIAIEKTIAGLNAAPVWAGLFTADFPDNSDLAQLRVSSSMDELVISKEPMGEAVWIPAGMKGSRIRATKIRFLTPDVALADVIGNGRAVLVLRKEGALWKIASLRLLL
jgi:hypothetical protein